jgi:hypothetical protein
MPATSLKQKKFMDAVAHNPSFAKQAGVPQSVGKDFSEASKGMKFGSGSKSRADSQTINSPKTNQGKQELFKKGGSMATKKMNPKMMAFEKSGKDVEKKGVKEGSKADMAMDKMQMAGMKKGGGVKKMAAGGFTSEANGVAQRGKTKAKQIVMPGNKGMKKGGKV